ncbi:Membrane protein TerC, possibly involved in tellurium resistance [gamma proteobacterium HdN1]|nr:Membrane protein TerC, possibly involved in tellurium resistance [gamma proteobacterium HdN1]
MFEWIADPSAWMALGTLTLLEIVLGVDNIIFISILVGRLPEHQRERARRLGLGLAMFSRIALLLSLAWIMRLTTPLFMLWENAVTGRDLILLGGGLFLIAKATHEIHGSLEGASESQMSVRKAGFLMVLLQIAVIDIVFSLDSVITAVGLADDIPVMVIAIVLSVGIMMVAARPIGDFVDAHPTVKMLALSFLIMIGMALTGEGLGFHIPKAYIYFAMAFSLGVEFLNLRLRKKHEAPLELRKVLPTEVNDTST